MIILTKQQADQIRGKHGIYSYIEPLFIPDGTYGLPEDCKDDIDLIEVKNELTTITNIQTIRELPKQGQLCESGKIYYYNSETINNVFNGMIKCVQTHNRTIYPPNETPALFSFFRENTDNLIWIPNEYVELGWKRIYNGVQYEVIQKHQTLEAWTPIATIGTLWKSLAVSSEWVVGVAYKVNDIVTYQDKIYKCLQAHTSISTWSPTVTINVLWQLQ
jgi:hypothetical protein